MFEAMSSFPAHRSARRCSIVAALSLAACTLLPSEAEAATAQVRWLPSSSAAISRYDVYVRNAGAPYSTPAWSGNSAPGADGALEALVPFAPAASGADYFAVVAVGASGESVLSRELSVGTPIACRFDSCNTKTSCDFGNWPDGFLCDVGTADPCSAVCLNGVCGTTSGADALASDVAIDRLRFTSRSSGIKLSLKGKFVTEAALDPASTGAVIELRGPDGTVLYTSSIAAASFAANRSGQRFRFDDSGAEGDPASNGLSRLTFRRSGSKWIVTAEARTPALMEASVEPAITLVVRLGGACMRRVGAECEQKESVSMCR